MTGPTCGELFDTESIFYVTPGSELLVRSTREDDVGTLAWFVGNRTDNLTPYLFGDFFTGNLPLDFTAVGTESGEVLIGTYVGTAPEGTVPGGLMDFAAPFIGGAAPFIDGVTIDRIVPSSLDFGISSLFYGFNESGDKLFAADLSDGGQALYFDPKQPGAASTLLGHTGGVVPGIVGAEFSAITFFGNGLKSLSFSKPTFIP